MNKLIILLTLFALKLPLLQAQMFEAETDEDILLETRELDDFDKIIVSRGVNVTLIEGLLTKAEIHIKNSTPDNVIIEQKGMSLNIRMRAKSYKDVSVNVFLTVGVNTIREINAGTGSSITSEIILKGDQLKLESGADGTMNLRVEMNKIVVNTSSSPIKIEGTTDYLDLTASAGARFNSVELQASKVKANASLGSKVVINATEQLTAKAATGAVIEYSGAPSEVEIRTNLGGKVEKLE